MPRLKSLTLEEINFLAKSIVGDISIYQVKDNALKVLYFSDSLSHIQGMTSEEHTATLNDNALEAVIPLDRPYVTKIMLDCIETGKEVDCFYRIFHKTKGSIWVHVRGRVIGTLDGYPVLFAIFVNTTAETEFFSNVLDDTATIVLIIERNSYEILYANKTAQEYYHIDTSKTYGKKCYECLNGRTSPCPWCVLPQLANKDIVTTESMNPIRHNWQHIISKYQRWGDREAFVQFITDVSPRKQMEQRFNNSLQILLAANPSALCTFHINLTKNTCTEGHGTSPYIMKTLNAPTVDGLCANLEKIITYKKDLKLFHEKLNRQAMLASYNKGINNYYLDYRRLEESGDPIWVRSFINMLENPETGDIEGVIYSVKIEDTKREEEIFRIITEEEYDYVALLHVHTSQIEFIRLNSKLPPKYAEALVKKQRLLDFDNVRQFTADSWIADVDKAAYLKQSPLKNIIIELDKNGHYELSVRGHYIGRPDFVMCRKIQHYYLDDTKETVLIIQSDVTETYQQQLRESAYIKEAAAKAEDILNSISGGICELHMPDPDHLKVSYVNPQMYRMLGFEPGSNNLAHPTQKLHELVAKYAEDTFIGVHPDDRERIKKVFHNNYNSKQFSVPAYRMLGGNNKYFWVQDDLSLRRTEGNTKIFYATFRDVNEEVRLQQELEKRLAQEKLLRQEATSANAAKSEFLSRMSHDIRTPMNGIIGMTWLAREQENPPETVNCLNKIEISSKFLLGLINDILDMAKIESGQVKFRPEPYPLEEFLHYMNAIIKPLCEGKKQQLTIETHTIPGSVPIIDKLRINQVLFNLLSNAVKYTPAGGHIFYGMIFQQLPGQKLHVSIKVKDNGIGMDKKFQTMLYRPFTQEEQKNRPAGSGTGLGLAIVKKMVDLMKGTIDVESAPGEGTTFTVNFVIPYIHASELKKQEQLHEKQNDPAILKGKHVLICEDQPVNLEIATKMLEKFGIVVSSAPNGMEAVKTFLDTAVNYYDLILMDIRMPIMNGYEATQAIRRLPRQDAMTVPIVAMSADAYADDVKHSLDAGMNGHLAKPVSFETLKHTLLRHIQSN
jgi:signal transduction histidine kinase/ActR/RegA family two-component response regulator